jgi:hypothetical protein
MFFLLLQPVVDFRPLLTAASASRLSRPNWPGANPEHDFVRSLGLVRMRRRGGVENWAGEDTYADASLAVRLPDQLRLLPLVGGPIVAHASRVFRRFYSAGIVCRFETGLRLGLQPGAQGDAADTVRLIAACAAIPARVRNSAQASPLVATGKALAAHYLASSTNRKVAVASQPWWSGAGSPAIMLEFVAADGLVLPPHARAVSTPGVGGEPLHHAWLQLAGQRCSTWLLRSDTGADPVELRKLRIHLLRLHAERECLRLVLQAVSDGHIELEGDLAQSDAVQEYLDRAMPVVTQPVRDGVVQAQLLEVARSAIGLALPGQAASFEAMRKQMAEKVRRYIRRSETVAPVITNVFGDQMNTHIQLGNVSVSGDFNLVTAQNIQNSFNKAAGSEVAEPLKAALKELTLQVASLAKQLPAEEAEKVSKDLGVLTTEAVSKTPRKPWYELSASGLLEAAKTVAEMAAPVTTAVKAVLALLV